MFGGDSGVSAEVSEYAHGLISRSRLGIGEAPDHVGYAGGTDPRERGRGTALHSEWRMPWRADSYWTYDKGWAHFCNTPLRLYKRNQHEGGIATPFIAHWPKGLGTPGRFSGEVGHVVDVMPTVLELAGLSYAEASKGHEVGPLRGRSLVPVLKDRPPRRREELWFLYGPNRALRQGDWKLVSQDRKPWELYRVSSDRTEQRDLAAAKPDLVARMAERWNALAKEYRAPNPGKNAAGG